MKKYRYVNRNMPIEYKFVYGSPTEKPNEFRPFTNVQFPNLETREVFGKNIWTCTRTEIVNQVLNQCDFIEHPSAMHEDAAYLSIWAGLLTILDREPNAMGLVIRF